MQSSNSGLHLTGREKWALAVVVALGIFFRIWILHQTGISHGGQNYYFREIVRGMQERGQIGLYPYRADAFVEFPEILNHPEPPLERVNHTLEEFGVSIESDSRFMEWTPLLRYPPGFPVFLYAAHGLLGNRASRVIILCIVLNGFMIALTLPVAWMLFGRKDVAWVSTVVNAFWIYTAKNSANYDPASLVIPVMMGVCYMTLKAWHTGEWKWVLGAATLAFVSANLRADTLFVSIFLPFALCFRNVSLRERWIKPAVSILTALALWIPWSYHNYTNFGVFRPFPAGAGFNILVTIGKYAPESGFPKDDPETVMYDLGADYIKQRLWASDVTYPDGIARDRKKMGVALAWIKDHPYQYIRIMFVHIRYFFFTEEEAVEFQIRSWFRRFPARIVTGLVWMAKWIEPLAILLAAWCMWIGRRDSSMMVPVLLLWGYVLPHMPLWVESRYFKAAWPIVLILSTASVFTLGRKKK